MEVGATLMPQRLTFFMRAHDVVAATGTLLAVTSPGCITRDAPSDREDCPIR